MKNEMNGTTKHSCFVTVNGDHCLRSFEIFAVSSTIADWGMVGDGPYQGSVKRSLPYCNPMLEIKGKGEGKLVYCKQIQ